MSSDRWISSAYLGITAAFAVALLIVDLVTGQGPGPTAIIHENNPINWLTGLDLLVAGAAAAIAGKRMGPFRVKGAVALVLGMAFLLGGLDELLELHEWLGSRLDSLRSSQASSDGGPAYLLALYAVGAVGALALLRALLVRVPYTWTTFCIAVVFQWMALFCEHFFQWADSAPKPWVLFAYVEELGELAATALFAVSMILLCRASARSVDS